MAVTYQIPRTALYWLLSILVLLVLPHTLRLPIWVMLLSAFCIGWRVLIHKGKIGYPGRCIKALLVFSALPLSVWQFRSDGEGVGVDLAVCLLIIGAKFKLLEMRYRRDIYILIILAFMLALTGFIYSQTLVSSFYNLGIVLLILTTMVLLNRNISATGSDSVRMQGTSLRLAGILILQSIPVMLILFILVPRITPLWAMPLPASSTRTGISDEMTPGSISQLGRSGELAFRVTFNGKTPPHEMLYWRGLVLDNFDGQTWRRSEGPLLPRGAFNEEGFSPAGNSPAGAVAPLVYDVILEPTQQQWLYGIRLAQVNASEVIQDRYDNLVSIRPISQRYRYLVQSYPDAPSDINLPRGMRNRALQLPEDGNPRTHTLAAELRAEYDNDRDLINSVLRHYNEEPFFYTLTPPALQGNSIDAFLFDTRQGFCGHYAGSMVYLLRAAGIPARVVVGYQGAESNPFEEYLMIYQYNAHAWVEVWLQGEGWVRFDPTAWVAPERITQGMEAFFGERASFLEETTFSRLGLGSVAWLNVMRLRLDAMEYTWNRFVISYNSDLQLDLLQEVFGENAREYAVIALVALITLCMALVAAFMWWRNRRQALDPVLTLYLNLTDMLAAKGLPRSPAEGPVAYCERIGRERPELYATLKSVTRQFVQAMYRQTSNGESNAENSAADKPAMLREQVVKLKKELKTSRT